MRRPAAGFSLVEVLVSLVIIGIGLLGLAKIQALAFASTTTSGLRSLAALEASGLASAMHANRNYWSALGPNFSYQFSGTAPPVSSDPTLTGATCSSACAAGPLAAFDVQNWVTAVNQVLPNVAGSINCPTNGPVSCTIWLRWTERTVGINAQSAGAANTMASPTYTLYVVP